MNVINTVGSGKRIGLKDEEIAEMVDVFLSQTKDRDMISESLLLNIL